MVFAIIDFDWLKYTCAAVGEKRTILVTHTASGREMEFKNRTEFYGSNKKGGWLAQRNANRTSPFEVSEFSITDIQTPEPVEFALHTAKNMLERALRIAGTKKYRGYLGKGDSFRVEESTVLKYKGNRKDLIKPVHLEALTEYLIGRWKAELVEGLEADDVCVIDCHKNDNILVSVDKDYYGCAVNYLNMNSEKITACDTFGELTLNAKGDVKGYGRVFYYFQIASGDAIDNYKANSASEIKWANKSAYNALKGCKTDEEAVAKLVEVYKMLYPEPKTIKGWRGDDITVDWLYMLKENLNMARMMTSYKDSFYSENDVLNWIDGKLF